MKNLRFGLSLLFACSAACGGVDRSSPAAPPVDAAADAAVDASAPATPPACGVGTWGFAENGDPCGSCVQGITDFVTVTIHPGMADGGGSVSDSEGNTWQYDPVACTLTAGGTCGTADTIDFGKKTASCNWTCGDTCPACAGQCTFGPY